MDVSVSKSHCNDKARTSHLATFVYSEIGGRKRYTRMQRMEHRSSVNEDGSLAGGWWTDDHNHERRFCWWLYDPTRGEIHVRRGMVTRSWKLRGAHRLSVDDLKVKLPKVALDIANGIES
jgi:hypothetical protein